jgi:hypothetical protein
MKRRGVLRALVTTGLTVAGLGVATPAQADVACTITNFSPRSVTVGLTPVTATFSVSTSGCNRAGWTAEDDGWAFYVYDDSPQETFNPWNNSEAGAMDVIVSAYNSDYNTRERVFANGFTLKRATTFQSGTWNAGPEPVRRGANVSLSGRLLIADWDNDRYGSYGGRPVDVQFRTATGTYTTVKTVTSDRYGWVRTTVPASSSGYWRLHYAGNTVAGRAVTAGDAVQVVR